MTLRLVEIYPLKMWNPYIKNLNNVYLWAWAKNWKYKKFGKNILNCVVQRTGQSCLLPHVRHLCQLLVLGLHILSSLLLILRSFFLLCSDGLLLGSMFLLCFLSCVLLAQFYNLSWVLDLLEQLDVVFEGWKILKIMIFPFLIFARKDPNFIHSFMFLSECFCFFKTLQSPNWCWNVHGCSLV